MATAAFIVGLWDFLFYYIHGYPYNWKIDTIFTLILFIFVWMMGSFYDKNSKLIRQKEESESLYRKLLEESNTVLESIHDVVFQTDQKGDFIYLNSAWTRLMGYELEETLGTSYFHYLSLGEKIGIRQRLNEYIDNKRENVRMEFRYRKKLGGLFWGEANIHLLYDSQGEFVGTIGSFFDITERKYAEKELMDMNQQLAMKSEKLSVAAQLAAGIAHEVRNPLTSINGFMQLLAAKNEDNKVYFDIIFSEIKRIELVLSELLVLAKPQHVQYRQKNVVEVLDQVVTLLETNAILHNIVLLREFEVEEAIISCDENQLKQVFINLIKNGMEAMPSGGTIEIAIRAGAEVNISIRDEGKGMSKEQIARLGEPFFTTKEKGTGLGMTVCFRILKDHHGDIEVSSVEGEGTTFNISLPLVPSAPKELMAEVQ